MTPSSFDKATVVDPLVDSDWDSSVLEFADYSFFHTSAWARVLNRTYGHRPVYQRCWRDGKAAALLPLMEVKSRLTGVRGVCLPFSDFCAPLTTGTADLTPLVKLIQETAARRAWKHFELRGNAQLIENAPASDSFYGHELDLRPKPEALLASFNSSVRRAIGKAKGFGLSVHVLKTREAVVAFYRLHSQTRRRFGIPPQPFAFFENIYEEIIKPGLGMVVIAKSGLQALAGAIFFQTGRKAVYKFGASDRRFQEQRANNLVMWEAIQYLKTNGAEWLHFGRTSLENEGLRRFKLAWATKEEMISYLKFDTAANAWAAAQGRGSGFHQLFFRNLPLALNRLAGALIYPHLD